MSTNATTKEFYIYILYQRVVLNVYYWCFNIFHNHRDDFVYGYKTVFVYQILKRKGILTSIITQVKVKLQLDKQCSKTMKKVLKMNVYQRR